MTLYELLPGNVTRVPATNFSRLGIRERDDLQRLLRDNIDVLDPDLLVIAEEFDAWDESRRRIDLLAVDRQANLVVIELKRTDDGGHMELQALRYAAMVAPMTLEQAVATLQRHLDRHRPGNDAATVLREFVALDELTADRFGGDVRIVLVAEDFSREITTTVMWLGDRDLDVRCFRFRPYDLEGRLLVDVQQVLPLPEADDYQVRLREKEASERRASRQVVTGDWCGDYYVNIDDGRGRGWADCRRYCFVSAGGGKKYVDAIRRLQPGDRFFAYQKGRGYVGMGEVVAAAVPVAEFLVDGRPILECDLTDRSLAVASHDRERCEWLCRVRWRATVDLDAAIREPHLFANQNAVCRLRDERTLQRLAEFFGPRCAADPVTVDAN